MSREEVAAVAVRLFAIAVFIYALRTVPSAMVYWNQNAEQNAIVPFLVVLFLIFLVAAVLWAFPRIVARKLLPRRVPEDEQFNWSSEALLQIALIVIGIYFLYYAISDAAYWVSFYIMTSQKMDLSFQSTLDQKAAIFTTLIELVIAIALILGSAGLARALHFIRFGRAS